jgi:hypothetical protein
MDTLPAARSNRDEMGEQESRADVYLTSRENKDSEAQRMVVHSRMVHSQRNNKDTMYSEVSVGRCGRSMLSLDKKLTGTNGGILLERQEEYRAGGFRLLPSQPKKTCPMAIKSPTSLLHCINYPCF